MRMTIIALVLILSGCAHQDECAPRIEEMGNVCVEALESLTIRCKEAVAGAYLHGTLKGMRGGGGIPTPKIKKQRPMPGDADRKW